MPSFLIQQFAVGVDLTTGGPLRDADRGNYANCAAEQVGPIDSHGREAKPLVALVRPPRPAASRSAATAHGETRPHSVTPPRSGGKVSVEYGTGVCRVRAAQRRRTRSCVWLPWQPLTHPWTRSDCLE